MTTSSLSEIKRLNVKSTAMNTPIGFFRGQKMKISFDEPDLPRSGAVVVGIWEEGGLTASARRLDEATSGAISRALGAATRFSGKKDQLLPIIAPANLSVSRILL